jgi:hypothetical protein
LEHELCKKAQITIFPATEKMEHRFKRHPPCGGMQIRMLSLMKRKGTYENHPFGDGSTDQSSIPEENFNDRAKPFNLSKYVSQYLELELSAAKCPPSWSMDSVPRYSRIYNAVDRLARKCLR